METVVHPAVEEDLDLLRLSRSSEPDYALARNAAIASVVLHLLLIGYLGSNSFDRFRRIPEPEAKRTITHLVDPPTQLTQTAPNRNKVTKELNLGTILPTPEARSPKPSPARLKPRAVQLPPAMAKRNPTPAPKIQEVEPPRIDVASNANAPKLPNLPPAQVAPPPPPVEKPKLVFESPNQTSAPVNKTPNPALVSGNPVQDAIKNVARGGSTGGQRVSEADLAPSAPGLNLPASPGRSQPDLELKSDPMGVDFRPYLIRVLAAVRRNWLAIYPEAARLGMRGQVGVEFVVAKSGNIAKVTYSATSGSRPLDEAAVAALSASNPLPPLPAEFAGQRVVLQFTFSYNIPKK